MQSRNLIKIQIFANIALLKPFSIYCSSLSAMLFLSLNDKIDFSTQVYTAGFHCKKKTKNILKLSALICQKRTKQNVDFIQNSLISMKNMIRICFK